jgi:hypothetical protein
MYDVVKRKTDGLTGNAWCDDSNLDSSVVLIFANEISSFL